MSDDQPYLSLVIPAYNEEERLKRFIPGIVEYLRGKGWTFEIIVANDGSQDGTARVTDELAKTHPMIRLITLNPNRGKGGAVRAGMLEARGRFVVFTDADQSTPIAQVDKLLAKLDGEGYDLVVGSRYMLGSDVQRSQTWHRALMGRMFRWAARAVCVRGVEDTQCGFKGMTRDAAQKTFSQVTTTTPIFDVEMLMIAARAGLRVAEVPVIWVHDHETRIPYTIGKAWSTWVELLRIRRHHQIVWPLRLRK